MNKKTVDKLVDHTDQDSIQWEERVSIRLTELGFNAKKLAQEYCKNSWEWLFVYWFAEKTTPEEFAEYINMKGINRRSLF